MRQTQNLSKPTVRGRNVPATPSPMVVNPELVFFSILLFALALRLTALFIPHNEVDKVIYLTLAEKVSQNFSD